MCGIVGYINQNTFGSKMRQDWFDQALYTDALRGWDSTGIFAVDRNKNVDVFKKAMTAVDFQNMRPYFTLANKYSQWQYMIGHNRKATRGAISHHNAHPFIHGDIAMVHNGTLDNHRSGLPDGSNFVVDSDALAYSIDKIGAEETFGKALGAFACAWYNLQDDTISIVRNAERPLSYAKVEDGVIMASEKMMLLWLADRNLIKIKELIDLPVGEIHTFDAGHCHQPEVKKIELAKPVKANWQGGGGKKHGRKKTNGGTTTTGTTTTKGANSVAEASQDAKEKADKRRELVERRRLRKHGLKKGEHIIVDSLSFTAFDKHSDKSNPLGRLDCLYDDGDSTCLMVEAYGIRKSDYVDGAAYCGKVQCLRCDEDPARDTIVIHDIECLAPQDDSDEYTFAGVTVINGEIVDPEEHMHAREQAINEVLDEDDDWDDADWENLEEFLGEIDEEEDTDENDVPRFRGPAGRQISQNTFDILTEDGCVYCSTPLDSSMANTLGWLDVAHGGGAACPDCYEEYKTMGVFLNYSKWQH